MKKMTLFVMIAAVFAVLTGCDETPEAYQGPGNDEVQTALIGYITEFDADEMYLLFDQVEWLTENDRERLTELEIDSSMLNNGYYIHNGDPLEARYVLREDTEYQVISWGEEISVELLEDRESFAGYLAAVDSVSPYWIKLDEDGAVLQVTQQYIP